MPHQPDERIAPAVGPKCFRPTCGRLFAPLVASNTSANSLHYYTYNRYDRQSRLVLAAQPSAVTGIDETTLTAATVCLSAGLVDVTNYFPATGTVAATGVNHGMPTPMAGESHWLNLDNVAMQIQQESFTCDVLRITQAPNVSLNAVLRRWWRS